MEKELSLKFGGFGETTIHPVALGLTILMAILILVLPRRYAIAPLIAIAILIPLQQRIVIGSLDFMMMRIMILSGWIRIILRSEFRSINLNSIDRVFVLWVIASIVSYTLLWQTSGAFVNRLGLAFNALGMYFLCRFLFLDFSDIERVIKTLVVVSVLVAVCMLAERATGRNALSVFGGVPEFTIIRGGLLRCQGAFAHAIVAGTFGATLLPLFVSLWSGGGRDKKLAVAGGVAATVITVTSSSSGPILSYVAGLVGLYVWRIQSRVRVLVWGGIFGVIGLHMVMKAPVWALLARVTVLGASTGYHRYILIDQFIKHFDEWWLFGTKFTSTWGFGLWDITNHYVQIGISGGLMTLILFIAIIVFSFRGLGRAIQTTKDDPGRRRLAWGLGAALFAHVVTFVGISYWDQMILIWYLLLAMISTVTGLCIIDLQEDKNVIRTRT